VASPRSRRAAGLILLLTPAAPADVDISEYVPRAEPPATEQAQAQVRAQIEAERAAEQQRAEEAERARRLADARARRVAAEAEARRPYPERLLRSRCSRCHELETFAPVRHSAAGWLLTVARMRWLNGAELPAREGLQIAWHLSGTQPAATARALLEYTAASLPLWLALLVRAAVRRPRPRRRPSAPP
jgi:hypothetical protein